MTQSRFSLCFILSGIEYMRGNRRFFTVVGNRRRVYRTEYRKVHKIVHIFLSKVGL